MVTKPNPRGDLSVIIALLVLYAVAPGCDATLLDPSSKKDSRRLVVVDGVGGDGAFRPSSDAPFEGNGDFSGKDRKSDSSSQAIPDRNTKPKLDLTRHDMAKPDTRRPDTFRPDLRKPDTTNPNVLTAIETDLFNAINAERSGKGLGKVTIDTLLLCAARDAVLYCCSPQCHHYNCDDGTAQPGDRVIKCGGSSAQASKSSEIGAGPGFANGAQVVSAWAGDTAHAKVLNHSQATTVGVGGSSAGCYFAVFNVYPP